MASTLHFHLLEYLDYEMVKNLVKVSNYFKIKPYIKRKHIPLNDSSGLIKLNFIILSKFVILYT